MKLGRPNLLAGCGLLAFLCLAAQAQESVAARLLSDVAALTSRPDLGSWSGSHRNDKIELANYEINRPYEIDYRRATQWCAASIDAGRAALFFVPAVEPSLPQKQDPALTRHCRLQAIWFQTPLPADTSTTLRGLVAAWGEPNGASAEPDVRGWKLWKNIKAWHRDGIDIWLAEDVSRLVVYARRDFPRGADEYYSLLSPAVKHEVLDAAAHIVQKDPALTSAMLERSQCDTKLLQREPDAVVANRLSQWLGGAGHRAAALLVADAYVACSPPSEALKTLGAKFHPICPQDGPTYTHNFLDEARQLDSQSKSGELAGILTLANPCFFKGGTGWPDLAVAKGEQFLRDFPESEWSAWAAFAVARAHAIKLAGPVGDDPGQTTPLTASAERHERTAAIERFKQFLRSKPDAPESAFAWQEAWRLLAGLPPSQIHFGCGCE